MAIESRKYQTSRCVSEQERKGNKLRNFVYYMPAVCRDWIGMSERKGLKRPWIQHQKDLIHSLQRNLFFTLVPFSVWLLKFRVEVGFVFFAPFLLTSSRGIWL